LCNEIDDKELGTSPIEIAEGTDVYFEEVNSIANIRDTASPNKVTSADILILGVGNDDLADTRQTPEEFALAFNSLLNYLTQQVYTKNELIIVKTTQYYGSYGPSGGWTHGRSEAYANIIRAAVQDEQRVLLWDTHQIGLNENQVCHDKTVSNSDVIKVENTMLSNIFKAAYL
jgi:hypothetical protein